MRHFAHHELKWLAAMCAGAALLVGVAVFLGGGGSVQGMLARLNISPVSQAACLFGIGQCNSTTYYCTLFDQGGYAQRSETITYGSSANIMAYGSYDYSNPFPASGCGFYIGGTDGSIKCADTNNGVANVITPSQTTGYALHVSGSNDYCWGGGGITYDSSYATYLVNVVCPSGYTGSPPNCVAPVSNPPNPPVGLTASCTNSTTANLSWNPNGSGPSTDYYYIRVSAASSAECPSGFTFVSGSPSACTIDNAHWTNMNWTTQPGVAHTWWLHAGNSAGASGKQDGPSFTCGSACTPSWSCTGWGACNSGTQSRVCSDSNGCGVSTGKPAESQSCSSNPTCSLSGPASGLTGQSVTLGYNSNIGATATNANINGSAVTPSSSGSWNTPALSAGNNNYTMTVNPGGAQCFKTVVGNNCGNGTIQSPEQCDGSALGGETCASQGFAGGTLSCTASCTLNTSSCTPHGTITSFDSFPLTVTSGNSTNLQWATANMAGGSCGLSGPGFGGDQFTPGLPSLPVNHSHDSSYSTGALSSNTNYWLICTDSSGATVNRLFTVNVTAGIPVISITATTPTIFANGVTTFKVHNPGVSAISGVTYSLGGTAACFSNYTVSGAVSNCFVPTGTFPSLSPGDTTVTVTAAASIPSSKTVILTPTGGGATYTAGSGATITLSPPVTPTVSITASTPTIYVSGSPATFIFHNSGPGSVSNVFYQVTNGGGASCPTNYSISGTIGSTVFPACPFAGVITTLPAGDSSVTITPGSTAFAGIRSVTLAATSCTGCTLSGASALINLSNTPPPSITSITANPTRVRKGGSTTVTVTGTNLPASCSMVSTPTGPVFSNPISISGGTNGTKVVSNINQNTQFIVTCGSVTGSLNVGILPSFIEH